MEPSWNEHAACLDMDSDVFFATDDAGVDVAKAVCARCPVVDECLAWALAHGEDQGVWGGTSERERRLLLAERGRPCVECGTSFRPTRERLLVCSDDCARVRRSRQHRASRIRTGRTAS